MSTQVAETTTYAIDPAHTSVEFVVRHLMITRVRGRFPGVSGTIELRPGEDVPTGVQARIEAATIDTREPQRDAHLQSADFLEVEKNPTLEFASTRIDGTARDFTIYGNLTIHGVTREVALKSEFEGRAPDPWGGQRVGYRATTTINRKDFGLTWNAALETGGVMVGDEVRIELDIQAVLQK
jgi:polyisoprenoid-binding protein YceI